MPQTPSSDNAELTDAIQHLARCSALQRTFGLRKQADFSSMLDSAKAQIEKVPGLVDQGVEFVRNNPMDPRVLAAGGAGIGGLLGLGTGMMEDDPRRRRPLRTALTGALAGGALGAGAGLLNRGVEQYKQELPGDLGARFNAKAEEFEKAPNLRPGIGTALGGVASAGVVGNDTRNWWRNHRATDMTALRRAMDQSIKKPGETYFSGLSSAQLREMQHAPEGELMRAIADPGAPLGPKLQGIVQPPAAASTGSAANAFVEPGARPAVPPPPTNFVGQGLRSAMEAAQRAEEPGMRPAIARAMRTRSTTPGFRSAWRPAAAVAPIAGGLGLDWLKNYFHNANAARLYHQQADQHLQPFVPQ